jgi:hypothetical protein
MGIDVKCGHGACAECVAESYGKSDFSRRARSIECPYWPGETREGEGEGGKKSILTPSLQIFSFSFSFPGAVSLL